MPKSIGVHSDTQARLASDIASAAASLGQEPEDDIIERAAILAESQVEAPETLPGEPAPVVDTSDVVAQVLGKLGLEMPAGGVTELAEILRLGASAYRANAGRPEEWRLVSDEERRERIRQVAAQWEADLAGPLDTRQMAAKLRAEPVVTVYAEEDMSWQINGVRVRVRKGMVAVPMTIAQHIEERAQVIGEAGRYREFLKSTPSALVSFQSLYDPQRRNPAYLRPGADFEIG